MLTQTVLIVHRTCFSTWVHCGLVVVWVRRDGVISAWVGCVAVGHVYHISGPCISHKKPHIIASVTAVQQGHTWMVIADPAVHVGFARMVLWVRLH
jgi:hypothetical protein